MASSQLKEHFYRDTVMSLDSLSKQYDSLLETIAAKSIPSVNTLKTQGSDDLDFHNISVWCIKDALSEAFKAGFAIGQTTRPLSGL